MELRANGFWILGCSTLVSKFIYKCVQCRKLRRPVEEQQMAELPKERIEESAPSKNELKEALKQCDYQTLGNFLAEKQCEFVFSAPSASHAGGVWE